MLFYFDVTPKLAVLLLGAALALPWLCSRRLPAGKAAGWLYILITAQAVSLAVSTFFSQRVELSLFGSNWRSLGLITYSAILLFTLVTFTWTAGNLQRLRDLLRSIALAGSLASMYGIMQYFGWDPWQPASAYHAGEGIWTIVRPPGTMGHADYFSAWLLFVLFAGITLAATDAQAWRITGIATAALAGVAVVLSGTRGAIVGLLAGGVFLFLRVRPRIGGRALLAAVTFLLLAGLFYISPAGLPLRSRVHWISEDQRGGGRLLLWRDSLRLLSRYWAGGAGPEAFPAVFPQFQSVALSQAYPDFYYESPHNLLLDAGTQQGLPGTVILLGWISLGLWAGWNRGIRGACLSAALVAAVAAHMFTVFILPTGLYFYLVIAMLVSLRTEAVAGRASRSRVLAWLPAWAPVSAALIFLSWRMLAADRSLELARFALLAGRVPDAIAWSHDAQRRGLAADLWLARSLPPAASAEAIAAATRATQGEDAQNAWYTLAWLYARAGDLPHTEAALRATIRCAPNWFKPHWMLAQILRRRHLGQEALAEAGLAATLTSGKNPEVDRTLTQIRGAPEASVEEP